MTNCRLIENWPFLLNFAIQVITTLANRGQGLQNCWGCLLTTCLVELATRGPFLAVNTSEPILWCYKLKELLKHGCSLHRPIQPEAFHHRYGLTCWHEKIGHLRASPVGLATCSTDAISMNLWISHLQFGPKSHYAAAIKAPPRV